MLNAVPTAAAKATRQVVLRHPNSIECVVWKKTVKRVEADPESGLPSEAGGLPTMGGMGVLRSEDEEDYEYVERGAAKCLFCGVIPPAAVNEREDGLIPAPQQEAQIECLWAEGEVDEEGRPHFVCDSGDLVMVEMGLGTFLAFEITGQTGVVNIRPYVTKFVLDPRDHLNNLEPFIPDAQA